MNKPLTVPSREANPLRAKSRALTPRHTRLSSLTAALIVAGMQLPTLALATEVTQGTAEESTQQVKKDTEESIEVIEVRGFGRSLIKSINQKRFSDTVTEQLSADDLGALPDVSMADALTRLPGISAVRTGGQAAQINIRGMAGDFVFSTLNGREQVSTSGSRSIEFDQYPSELISSAAVYKSPKASLIEGGVAGSVELQTASPLANEKMHTFVANVRAMHNDRASEVHGADEFGDRVSFSYQGKFLDETLGVALGFARLYQPSVATQFIGFAYNNTKDVDNRSNDMDIDDEARADHEYISEGMELQHLGGAETRNGYMASIEWVPAENFKLKADGFVSRFDSESFARGFRVKFEPTSGVITNPVLDGNTMIGGNINRTSNGNTRVELVNDDNQDFDQINNFGINADWQVTDDLNVRFDVSHSSAESNFRNGLLWSLVAEDANAETPVVDPNVSINYLLNGLNLPDVGFSQADKFTSLDHVMVSKYGIYPYHNEDDLNAYRIDFKYTLDTDIVSSVEWGMRYSEREYSNQRSVFEYGSDASFLTSQPPLKLTEDMVNVVNWEGDFSYFPSYLAIDLDKALSAWFPNGRPTPVQTWGFGGPILESQKGMPGSDYSWTMLESGQVFEDVFSAYVMANLDTEVFGKRLTGNFGVRMVESDQSATTLENVEGDPLLGAQYITDQQGLVSEQYKPNIIGDSYTDYLPSLNLNLAITDNQQLRFAAAKVMGRAPINRLAGGISYTITDSGDEIGEINGNANNSPYLRPFYATQFDLSYEYYFEDTDGAFVAAIFHKDIESYVQNTGLEGYDFKGNGFAVPDSITVVNEESGEVKTVPTYNGTFTTAVNNEEGGYIRGLELAYTQVFSFLPGVWEGLGANLGYSYTESEVQNFTELGGDTLSQPKPGLSKHVFNATVFWGYEGFDTRLSMRYRDNFVSEQWGINQQVVNFDDELVVDYQASYQFNDNLSGLFQVNNLTDEPTRSFFGNETRTGTIQYFGRQFYLGFTYSL